MPTGYTYKLMEQGENFRAFALRCARAMGACVTMRDAPADAPIPDVFTPEPHYRKAADEAFAEMCRLKAMSEEERLAYGQAQKAQRLGILREQLQKAQEQNLRLRAMEEAVISWRPPTTGHDGLRTFMLQQIHISDNADTEYLQDDMHTMEHWSPMGCYERDLATAAHRVAATEKAYQDEVRRCAERTEWMRVLCHSLPEEE